MRQLRRDYGNRQAVIAATHVLAGAYMPAAAKEDGMTQSIDAEITGNVLIYSRGRNLAILIKPQASSCVPCHLVPHAAGANWQSDRSRQW
jgi:hypothetical protein